MNQGSTIKTHSKTNLETTEAIIAQTSSPEFEWARIKDQQVVAATQDRKWVRQVDIASGTDPFAEPMSGPESKATTRQLLDAAWCTGRATGQSNGATPRRSLPRYVRKLIGSYFPTSATSKLLRELANRFREAGRRALEFFARRFARLEDGDQQMAAKDLKDLGYQAEDLVANCAPASVSIAFRDYFAAQVRGPKPIDALGYAYAIERSSLSITAENLQELRSVIPPGIDAQQCRRHHSGVGGEVMHLKYSIHASSRLPAVDRARIARATYKAMNYISNVSTEDVVEDTELERQHKRYQLPAPSHNRWVAQLVA